MHATRRARKQWIASPSMTGMQYLWPSRLHDRPHMSTRQYARLLREWVSSIGLEVSSYGAFASLMFSDPLLTSLVTARFPPPSPNRLLI